ncbi:hypothetical protein M405DRAFT_837596 [Rhizopogon salebrosus TDB-379]|nr:hypothetical protein M405DRAFT_837596 [Rhizopogon salebrosus TDB-379]
MVDEPLEGLDIHQGNPLHPLSLHTPIDELELGYVDLAPHDRYLWLTCRRNNLGLIYILMSTPSQHSDDGSSFVDQPPADPFKTELDSMGLHPSRSLVNIRHGFAQDLAHTHRDSTGRLVYGAPVQNWPWEWIENIGGNDQDDSTVRSAPSLLLELFGAKATGDHLINPMHDDEHRTPPRLAGDFKDE